MLKLDTHSIQMIAICTILLSTIFLGYLEFKRLHYKLDSIADNIKTIEDIKTIQNKSKLHGVLPDAITHPNKEAVMPSSSHSVPINDPTSVNDENIVNKIFCSDSPVNMDVVTLNPENQGTGAVETYDNLDTSILNELDNLDQTRDQKKDDSPFPSDDAEGADDDAEGAEDDAGDVALPLDYEANVGETDIDDTEVNIEDNDTDADITMDMTLNTELNTELNNKKLKELRAILKERNLSVTGNKHECINRIIEDIQKNN